MKKWVMEGLDEDEASAAMINREGVSLGRKEHTHFCISRFVSMCLVSASHLYAQDTL